MQPNLFLPGRPRLVQTQQGAPRWWWLEHEGHQASEGYYTGTGYVLPVNRNDGSVVIRERLGGAERSIIRTLSMADE